MIVAAFKIQESVNGITLEQVALTDQNKATQLERTAAGVLDIACRLTFEFIAKNTGKGTMVEGKDIESYVEKELARINTKPFRKQLREIGIELPPQA
jgi:hypothetical protein